jgi:molybdopterin molybdotransferase
MKTLEQIGAELQGYDPQALRASDVNAFLAKLVEPVTQTETVSIFAALDRVLAQDVVSPISVPPHDNSAMDGFAFDGAQLRKDAPLALKVIGTAFAGKAWQGAVGPGECVKIMTGAIMPTGLDTVVPQEFTTVAGDASPSRQSCCSVATTAATRRRPDGRARSPVPRHAPVAGGLRPAGQPGHRDGAGVPPPAVAYFSTGDEILSLGEPPREGAVYDSNRYTVFGLLTRLGCEVIDLGVVRDEPALLEAAFTRAAQQADAIITSGGVSVGEADFTKTMMKQLGDVAFWRIAMRPGRPMAVGRISGKPNWPQPQQKAQAAIQTIAASPSSAILFGLPGNPVAVMVTFLAFVRPALLRMMGCTRAPRRCCAPKPGAIRKKPGRTEYQRGTVTTAADGTLQVRTTGNQGSGVLSSMVQANGLIVLHHGQGNVAG